MTQRRKRFARAGALLSAIMLGGLVTGAGGALAGPPEVIELPALREALNIPVMSLSERLPSHARAGGVAEPATAGCDKGVDFTTSIHNARVVGFQDNVICTNSDIDIYTRNSTTYVVQAGGLEAAWTHTDVSDPTAPSQALQFVWPGRQGENTNTPDIKAFKQGDNNYVVMGLERTANQAFCGVVIMNVNDLTNVTIADNLESQFIGADWCDTHNVFVETDGSGDGTHIYATANNTSDLRVLSIDGSAANADGASSVSNPVEVGQYRRGTVGFDPNGNQRGPNDPDGLFDDILVHDVTVVDHTSGAMVYASYWEAGLDIFPASSIKGTTGPSGLHHLI